jgi:signal transduction histidine kinase/DNA-binding response OmpR family regulator
VDYINSVIGGKRVVSVFYDAKGLMYVATYSNGLFVFTSNKAGGYSYTNYRNDKNIHENIKTNTINHVLIDNDGTLWLSMNLPALAKIYKQESDISFFSPKKNDNEIKEFSTVSQSKQKDKLWITTNGDGMYLFNTKTKVFEHFNSSSSKGLKLQFDNVSRCFQDKKGNIWIVYSMNGLYVVPAFYAASMVDEKNPKMVMPINANEIISNDSKLNSYITNFYEDSKGRLWIGSWGALYLVSTNTDFQIARTSQDLLKNSNTKCVYFDEYKEMVDFPIYPLISMVEVRNNTFWLGTFGGGIIELNENSQNNFTGHVSELNKDLPQMNVKCLIKDKFGGVWIGTNNGLGYIDPGKSKLRVYSRNDGLLSDDINSIVEDDKSNIWLSTNYGCILFNKQKNSIKNFLSSSNEDLNQYIVKSGSVDNNGHVWFATNEAVVTFNPDVEKNSLSKNSFRFTELKIDNKYIAPLEKVNGTRVLDKSLDYSTEVNIPYNHTLSLTFAIMNFKSAGHTLFKYRISKNSEWIILNNGQRNINLSSLKPGKYLLEVEPVNSNAGKQGISLRLNFLPPFWQTKVAFLIYFIFLLGLFWVYRRLTLQKLNQQKLVDIERYERKKLEEMDKMKTDFFSNISHEFRTPLSLIVNPLERFVKEEKYSKEEKERFNLILKSSNRLLKLTNELMDFSKIEKKLLVPEFQLCKVDDFVNEICGLFKNVAETMNIDFKVHSNVEGAEIPVDKRMIEKVIFNLLSNAFKYTPNNGIILVDIDKTENPDKEYVKINVVNSGEGITKENLTKIFDRFYQVNNVQNRNVEGTGIGLSLVKSYIELHNGIVKVSSEPNVETTFEIYLPFVQPGFSEDLKKNSIEEPLMKISNENISQLKPTYHYHLLIVEDDQEIRDFIVDELKADFNITIAVNGEEGLKIANEQLPDLIITDVMMPKLSGIELCQKLKNQMSTSHIPIIILSAKASTSNQIEGLEMGADVYMVKPFSIEHLKIQVLRLINFKEAIYSRYLKETTLIPEGALTSKLDEEFMKKIMAFIEDNLTDTNLSVDQLADKVSLSKVQTYRKVKAITGLSAVEFIRTVRLKKAAQLVAEKRLSYTEIAFETGFASASYFSKCFHDHFGKTPSEFSAEYGDK